MNSGEKLAIIGAGAIGSLVGGMLARAGKDVTLIGRKEHMEAVNKNGLSINGVVGEFNVQIKTAEKLDFKPDIVFLAGKTQDVEESCLEIKPLIGDIPIVLMQNGVRSADIAASILGEKNIISCILLLNAQFLEPGIVTCINQKPSIIGEMFDKNGERIKQIQALLNHVSETIISDNIRGAQWTKLFINAMGNSIDAMTGLTLGEYVKYYNIRKIAVQILKEALKVVETATIKLEKLPGIPISAFKTIIKMPTPLAAFILKYAMSSKGNSDIVTSTLQSIRKGKKTEIDYINGEFVKLGMRIGVQTPYNSKVVELIHTIEDSGDFFAPDELSTIFQGLEAPT